MISLLLLDLDGVVVVETVPPGSTQHELILLHTWLNDALRRLGMPVVVVTHRSRVEADLILRTAGITELAGVLAAEDIARIALRSWQPWQLVWRGLCKSWVLTTVEQRYGVGRRNIAFVDNQSQILDVALANGIGLAVYAPSIVTDRLTLISFDIDELVQILANWRDDMPTTVRLTPRAISIKDLSKTGVATTRVSRHVFNLVRRVGRMIRTVTNVQNNARHYHRR